MRFVPFFTVSRMKWQSTKATIIRCLNVSMLQCSIAVIANKFCDSRKVLIWTLFRLYNILEINNSIEEEEGKKKKNEYIQRIEFELESSKNIEYFIRQKWNFCKFRSNRYSYHFYNGIDYDVAIRMIFGK